MFEFIFDQITWEMEDFTNGYSSVVIVTAEMTGVIYMYDDMVTSGDMSILGSICVYASVLGVVRLKGFV